MSVSMQSSGGTSVINKDGNVSIKGDIKSLKVNGESIGEFKETPSVSSSFISGVLVGFLAAYAITILL